MAAPICRCGHRKDEHWRMCSLCPSGQNVHPFTAMDFDPFEAEIWDCHCPLCHELSRVAVQDPYALPAHSRALHDALTAGTHVRVARETCPAPRSGGRGYQSSGSLMDGLGIGVTPGGVAGSRYRAMRTEEKRAEAEREAARKSKREDAEHADLPLPRAA